MRKFISRLYPGPVLLLVSTALIASSFVTSSAVAGRDHAPVVAARSHVAAAKAKPPYIGEVLVAHTPYRYRKDRVLRYQWERCNRRGHGCAKIKGATYRRYKVRYADLGHRLRVALTVAPNCPPGSTTCGGPTNGPTSVTVVSAPTAPISLPTPVNTVLPVITGTAQQGQVLTGTLGTWQYAITYQYQWEDCDVNGNNCVAIAGATGITSTASFQPTYTLQASDVGDTIRLEVTAYNYNYTGNAVSGFAGERQVRG